MISSSERKILKKAIIAAGYDYENNPESYRDFISLMNEITKLKEKYKHNPLKQLCEFEDANHLEKYISSAFHINKLSNDKDGSHFRMNHILFKIVKQNYISLYNLLSYQFNTKSIIDLKKSYLRSSELQEVLGNSTELKGHHQERLSWFVNLKSPTIYWKNSSVKKHYSYIIKYLTNKPQIDKRRIHIFYEDYLTNPLNRNQVIELFKGLFFEKLIGIENKVIILNNYDDLEPYLHVEQIENSNEKNEKVPEKGENKLFKSIFMLDYALYQFPLSDEANDSLDYELHLLPANFSIDPPITSEKEEVLLKSKYKKQLVFEIEGPYLFYVFKRNFNSFWNKNKFIDVLDNLLFPRVWLNLKTYKKQILDKILKSLNSDGDPQFVQDVYNIKDKLKSNPFIHEVENLQNNNEFATFLDSVQAIFNENEFLNITARAPSIIDKGFIKLLFEFLDRFNKIVFDDFDFNYEMEKEIFTIRDKFAKNIDVLDFFSFWKKISLDFSLDDLFSDGLYLDEVVEIDKGNRGEKDDPIKPEEIDRFRSGEFSINVGESAYIKRLEEQSIFNYKKDDFKAGGKDYIRIKDLCRQFFSYYVNNNMKNGELNKIFEKTFTEYIIN